MHSHTNTGQVHVDVHGGRLRIANTEGMTSADPDAFEQPFAKGQASTGYGLGLAIMCRLCEHYGIDLQFKGDLRGTTVTLAFDTRGVAGLARP